MPLKNEWQRTTDLDHECGRVSPGLTAQNFRKIAQNGFGDPYNSYAHSMTWFQDHLYVGTSRACLAARGFERANQHPELLGETWPVRIPDDIYNIDLRAEIWRYHPPIDEWSKVFTSPMVRGIDGFEVPLSSGFRCMTPFQGLSDSAPALYIPTWATHQRPESVMLRSGDGANFEVVSEPGLGLPDLPRALRGFVSFKGRLFMSPAMGQKRWQHNIAGAALVYGSSDPARGDWQLACEPHFGNPNNLTVIQMATFNGYLYAGTLNINEGFQVWKTDAEGEPPYKWKKVVTHGAYRGKLNQIAGTMQPFRDHLYVGGAIQLGGYDIDNKVGPGQPEVIRINPDDSWDLVVGEPRLTPEGLKLPLSGLGAGFRNPFAGYLWSMCVHAGWLYVGNLKWIVYLRYAKRGNWPGMLRIMFTPKNVEKWIEKFGGFDLWRSRDGYRWIPVTLDGFGNCYNFGIRNMVSTSYGLFVGVANPFAPEVAVRRVAGWNYENNPKGGLEIWLGSHNADPAGPLSSSEEDSICLTGSHLMTKEATESDEEYLEEIMGRFYGGSDFRHFGYWRVGIDDARTACENLMDEILAFIPEKKGTIIDIGCGLGATTQYLLKYFPPEAVTGITTDKRDLETCQKKAPHVKFLYRKLPKLKLPEESSDFVIWVKGLSQLGARRKLLRESFHLLKPGGRLVCFDVLSEITGKDRVWKNIWPIEGAVRTLDEYQNLLLTTGFQGIQLTDVAAECLEGFRKHIAKYFGMKRLSGEMDNDTLHKVEAYLLMAETPVRQCLLISGCKPGKEQKSRQD